MESFSCFGRLGTPVRPVAVPSRIDVRRSALTFSYKLVVFSTKGVSHFCNDQDDLPVIVPSLMPSN
jgi:hypothetical protein